METKVVILFITLIFIVLLLITSLLFLFWKRTRRIGLWTFSVLTILLIGFGFYHFTPRHFKRNYLFNTAKWDSASFRPYSDTIHFYIGAAGDAKAISDPLFNRNFNSITPENDLKMRALLKNGNVGQYDFRHTDSLVNSALSKNMRVRGHTLIWGKLSDRFKAPDLERYLKKFPAEQRRTELWNLMENYITTVLNHYRGKIKIWDVVNEPLQFSQSRGLEKNVYYRYLGEGYIAKSFLLAKSVDPDLKLYLNEQLNGYSDKRAEAFYELVKKLKDNAIPITGVGIQSHVILDCPDLGDFERYLKRIAALGLEIEITELDARLRLFKDTPDPYKAQGEFYGKLLSICLNIPACKGVTFWGYCDNHCWYDHIPFCAKPNEPYLFDKYKKPKPAYESIYTTLKQYAANRYLKKVN